MSEPEELYYHQFIERTRQLRKRSGYTSAELARRLGINGGTYRQYERRSPLPLHLIARFARFVQCDIAYLITGDHRRVSPLAPRTIRATVPAPEPVSA